MLVTWSGIALTVLSMAVCAAVLGAVLRFVVWPANAAAAAARPAAAAAGDGAEPAVEAAAPGAEAMDLATFRAERARLAEDQRQRRQAQQQRKRRGRVVRKRKPRRDRAPDEDGSSASESDPGHSDGDESTFEAEDDVEAFDPSSVLGATPEAPPAGLEGPGARPGIGMDSRDVTRAMRRQERQAVAEYRLYTERVRALQSVKDAEAAKARAAAADERSARLEARMRAAEEAAAAQRRAYEADWRAALGVTVEPAWKDVDADAWRPGPPALPHFKAPAATGVQSMLGAAVRGLGAGLQAAVAATGVPTPRFTAASRATVPASSRRPTPSVTEARALLLQAAERATRDAGATVALAAGTAGASRSLALPTASGAPGTADASRIAAAAKRLRADGPMPIEALARGCGLPLTRAVDLIRQTQLWKRWDLAPHFLPPVSPCSLGTVSCDPPSDLGSEGASAAPEPAWALSGAA